MQKSESIKNLVAALVKFQGKQIVVGKDAANPFFKSKYASLSHIQQRISKDLNECGLSYMQLTVGASGLTTILAHESGEWISSTSEMTPTKNDPQGQASAITYQRRYGLVSILGLNVGDQDDDGNAASAKNNGASNQAVLIRIAEHIKKAKTPETLAKCYDALEQSGDQELMKKFKEKLEKLEHGSVSE